jgi:hypothetical protein
MKIYILAFISFFSGLHLFANENEAPLYGAPVSLIKTSIEFLEALNIQDIQKLNSLSKAPYFLDEQYRQFMYEQQYRSNSGSELMINAQKINSDLYYIEIRRHNFSGDVYMEGIPTYAFTREQGQWKFVQDPTSLDLKNN